MGQIGDLMRAALNLGDTARYDLRGTDDDAAWTYQGECCRLLAEAIPQVDALEGPVAPPEPPPVEPAHLQGVAITYPGHQPAYDLYLGYTEEQVAWGRHDGLPICAPVAGVVSLYSFSVGRSLTHLPPETQALFAGWVCIAPSGVQLAGLQPMYVAVLVYDTPIQTPWGTVKVDWAAHVRGNVKTGRVAAGEQYATCWDSGIRFEDSGIPNARAAHVHACASATGSLSPNGDLDGRAFGYVRGWEPLAYLGDGGPGPSQYQQGRYTAGRLTSDFKSAGKPIPPLPGSPVGVAPPTPDDVSHHATWPS